VLIYDDGRRSAFGDEIEMPKKSTREEFALHHTFFPNTTSFSYREIGHSQSLSSW